ncbi:radical SAM protein [Frankia sp. CNm7]|uniref:Radical SAM protein n=1 Tax=Frankia nepalensis TaxID=1836974 RepID=A0A937RQ19_9ACTN|nr:radical SAM protein [Frankia nepalensis]MBL7502050.1 radical SAM protein [Frankia nepalensis]MBL7511956.1 radical SAM protein [Frankia nepalensis]MBL7524054.1 radical SAM protein [Frankia nepalensis]MBL7630548.1 radical SAM protein [Frankia nepalensis]
MRTMLINPPYQTITNRWGVGHQVPLGLLLVGGGLVDHGHEVSLLDAEAMRLSCAQVAAEVRRRKPDVVMTGHAGSTPAHPVCMEMFEAIRQVSPGVTCVYGGVFPTYHDEQVLRRHRAVDVVVRGEGEATAVALLNALQDDSRDGHDALAGVEGLTYRSVDGIVRTPDRSAIPDLDEYRAAWELIDDWDRYECFGRGRAAIVQFSRGCPHRCTYCGQHGFWKRWRHRDPSALVDEIAWLHDEHGIRFVTFADENPTTLGDVWTSFLDAMARRDVDVTFFATIRATDVVRAADRLDLWHKAGLRYVLLGIDTTDPAVLAQVRKRSSTRDDFEACRLLREHGIHSIIGHVVGLGDEKRADLRRARQALARYDGDYLNAMYATPHSWTSFAREQEQRRVVQEDQRRWDYRHQVLEQRHLRPWHLFAAVKWLELSFHLRPRRLRRLFLVRDPTERKEAWWTARHTGLVWLAEILDFVRNVRFSHQPRPLSQWPER